jgi:hypothetical protein
VNRSRSQVATGLRGHVRQLRLRDLERLLGGLDVGVSLLKTLLPLGARAAASPFYLIVE